MEDDEEWLRWRLVFAEDSSVTATEAMNMDTITLNIANAALDKMLKLKNEATKKASKKKGR